MHLLSKKRYILLMLLPTLILYIGYVIVPIGVSFYYSLTTFTGIGAAEFVGWRNFGALAQDPLFWDSLKNTLIVLVVSLVVLVPCALGVGLLFQAKMRGSSVLRAFVFSPSVIAPILVGLIWVFVLDPQIGFINSALRALGIRGALPLWLFLQVKDFKPLSRPFLQLLSQPDSCYVAQTHEAHGVATAVCGSKRLVEVRRICCYAPFATPSGGNAGT